MTNADWMQFLTDKGANWEQDTLVDFGNSQQELSASQSQDIICDLSHFAVVKVSGEDAQTFLQGQFSNDVNLLNPELSQLNSYNSPKGRMLAGFRLFMIGNDFYLRLPTEIAERTIKRLRMFVMRSKVVIDDVSENLLRIGLAGPNAAQLLDGLPSSVDQVQAINDLYIIKVPGIQDRYELFGGLDAAKSLWEQLSEKTTPVGKNVWALLDIQAGIPNIYNNTIEEFVPQMVNLHAINGVSFTKGCYPGQEIVARMHYLGKLKKRMFHIHVDSNEAPQPKDDLFEQDSDNQQSVGQIVDAAPSPNGGFDALAVIQINSANEKKLSVSNAPISVQELPYDVSNEA